MAKSRRLRIVIEVDDEGGPDDYDQISAAIRSMGAEIVEEEEV